MLRRLTGIARRQRNAEEEVLGQLGEVVEPPIEHQGAVGQNNEGAEDENGNSGTQIDVFEFGDADEVDDGGEGVDDGIEKFEGSEDIVGGLDEGENSGRVIDSEMFPLGEE